MEKRFKVSFNALDGSRPQVLQVESLATAMQVLYNWALHGIEISNVTFKKL